MYLPSVISSCNHHLPLYICNRRLFTFTSLHVPKTSYVDFLFSFPPSQDLPQSLTSLNLRPFTYYLPHPLPHPLPPPCLTHSQTSLTFTSNQTPHSHHIIKIVAHSPHINTTSTLLYSTIPKLFQRPLTYMIMQLNAYSSALLHLTPSLL
jgi:hypothetical protein